MMSGPNSPNLNPLDYQVWGKCRSLNKKVQLQQKPKPVPEFENALWSALQEKAIDNAVKDCHKRLQTRVSASGGHFEHLMS